VDLSHNPGLNSLSFRSVWIHIWHPSPMYKAGVVQSLLGQVTSSEVRRVEIEILTAAPELLKEVDWDSIAKILQQPNFSKLEAFVISDIRKLPEEAKCWMMQRLPPGRAKDKLEV
jgi:hypothetical protein